jgi:hypothetical protein
VDRRIDRQGVGKKDARMCEFAHVIKLINKLKIIILLFHLIYFSAFLHPLSQQISNFFVSLIQPWELTRLVMNVIQLDYEDISV